MIETTLAFGGRLDILVNNAAFDVQGSITELSLDDWQSHLAVNLTGPFVLMKTSIPVMIKGGGGSIINISSLGGLQIHTGETGVLHDQSRPHHAHATGCTRLWTTQCPLQRRLSRWRRDCNDGADNYNAR
jgi:NAD(P)-dependent dehydrogenase (short-subunit alcohol dehydrogenase family)